MTDVTQAAVESPEPAPYEFPAGLYDMAHEIAQDAYARLNSLNVDGFVLGIVRISIENIADETEITVDNDGDYIVSTDEGDILVTNYPDGDDDEGDAETAEPFVDVIEGYEADGDTDQGITATA